MTINDFGTCLKARLKWYQNAISLKEGTTPWINGFDFPEGNVDTWRGAAKELKNSLDMLDNLQPKLSVSTALGPIVAIPKTDLTDPGIEIFLGGKENQILIARIEADTQAHMIQTVAYKAVQDEPASVDEFCSRHANAQAGELGCKNCGTKMVWEHPDVPGLYMQSSTYIGSHYCYDCMCEYCNSTNCLSCDKGQYPNCPYAYLKDKD